MSAEFNFSTPTTLTLLVGGFGDINATGSNGEGGGGEGGSFVVQGSTPLVVAGGGGGFAVEGGLLARGGNATITTFGSAGGGDAGGSGGTGGGGGSGGDRSLTGFFNYGEGGAGGGGFYTDGTGERPVIFYGALEAKGAGDAAAVRTLTAPGAGGLSFEDGGAGALSNFGGSFTGNGGFGGGGGGYSDNSYGFGGGGGFSGGGGGGAFNTTTIVGGGGGGGSFIDSSAIATLAEVSGTYSPDGPLGNGEIVITNVLPNIFQWQYINPSDPSLGKKISTTFCPGGAGVIPLPSASLSGLDLTQAYLPGAYLSGANLVSTTLTNADLIHANLANANLSGATLTNAYLTNAYLTHANLLETTLAGATLAGANLISANLTNANLTNVNLSNANLNDATLTGANLTNANLTNAFVFSSTLTNANLTNADLRGAYTTFETTTGAIFTNTINTGGTVNGLHLTAAAPLMTIHNYHAPQGGSTSTGAIHVSGEFALDAGTTLQMIFDGPQWNSLISFDAGIRVTLTGNLDLEVDPSVDPSSLVGIPFQLFDFSNVTLSGQFAVSTDLSASQFQWDTSQLYSDGIVTLDAVPEPTSASLLAIGSLALLRRRVRRSNVESAK